MILGSEKKPLLFQLLQPTNPLKLIFFKSLKGLIMKLAKELENFQTKIQNVNLSQTLPPIRPMNLLQLKMSSETVKLLEEI